MDGLLGDERLRSLVGVRWVGGEVFARNGKLGLRLNEAGGQIIAIEPVLFRRVVRGLGAFQSLGFKVVAAAAAHRVYGVGSDALRTIFSKNTHRDNTHATGCALINMA